MHKRTRSRECALQILYTIDISGSLANDALATFWIEHPTFAEEVRKFSNELVEGVYANIAQIDKTISKYAINWTLKRMAVVDRNILRLAVYELLFKDDIPPKVTINEAVEIAKKFGDANSSKFVNAILDKIGKETKRIEKG